jgi:hypothetical protein
MPSFVHVARILPGQRDAFRDYVRSGFENAREGCKAFGFTKITSFITEESAGQGDALLVTVYEARDADVVDRFYKMPAVIEGEKKAHGVMVAPHDHDALPTNTPFLELDLT